MIAWPHLNRYWAFAPKDFESAILETPAIFPVVALLDSSGCEIQLASPNPSTEFPWRGFGDLREVELLVEEGFTPERAIRIASYNGALFLGLENRVSSLAPGKDADLVVVKGNPSRHIDDIENVETVFKDGIGYDTQKLLESVKGHYGQY